MPSSILLWDDSSSQCFELEMTELEHRVHATFRVWHLEDPQAVHAVSGKRSRRDRRAEEGMAHFLAGETTFRLDELSRAADKLASVASFLATNAVLEPLGREFRLQVQRHVFVPQVRIELTVDGNVYLPHPPVVPGHSELTLRFWATDDALLAFAEALDEVATSMGGTSRWEARRGAARASAAGASEKGPASPLSPLGASQQEPDEEATEGWSGPPLFWEDLEESLHNPEQQRREEEEWERLNEEWVLSHMRERKRRPHASHRQEGDEGLPGEEESEETAQEPAVQSPQEPFVELPADDPGGLPERLPELATPSAEADSISAIREAKEEDSTVWLELQQTEAARREQASPHVDTRTGVVWPGTINADTLSLPPAQEAGQAEREEARATTQADAREESGPAQEGERSMPPGEAQVGEARDLSKASPPELPPAAASQRELFGEPDPPSEKKEEGEANSEAPASPSSESLPQ